MSKSFSKDQDPNLETERKKYESPIVSREYIIAYLEEVGTPVEMVQMLQAFNMEEGSESQWALKRRLRAMERDDQIFYSGKGFYGLVSKTHVMQGHVTIAKDGQGEVVSSEGERLLLPVLQLKAVFNGDEVLSKIVGINAKGRYEGEIERVLKRHTFRLIGRIYRDLESYYVRPFNKTLGHDVLLLPNDPFLSGSIEAGTLVRIEIVAQPSHKTQAVGQIIEIIGDQVSLEEVIQMVTKNYTLEQSWTDEILQPLLKQKQAFTKKDLTFRKDLRHLSFVTIDGEDAKDFDDAVYGEPKPSGGWRLYVAIADVSHYVKPDSALDKAAYLRSTSVYLPDRVIPMLPEQLSNDWCSLRPDGDRLALVCEMTISKKGRLSGQNFYSAVIRSKARLTYDEVAEVLEGSESAVRKFDRQYPGISKHLFDLYGLYHVLKEKRQERGAIDFDLPETKIHVDLKTGLLDEMRAVERNDAHRLIEECMLLANVSAAKWIAKHGLAMPYRVHETSSMERVENLNRFLKVNQIPQSLPLLPETKDYANLLMQLKERSDYENIQMMFLRSMNQAIYSPNNEGHFGLAYKEYTHFTSPIRRYPDLIVHRLIKHILQKESSEKNESGQLYSYQDLVLRCEHASERERAADAASKEVEEWLKCRYMLHQVGDVFSSKIVSVMGHGFFVRLLDSHIEGFVPIASLRSDYFLYDMNRQVLVGEHSKQTLSMGDILQVRLIQVNMHAFKIDFEVEGSVSKKRHKVRKSKKYFKSKKKPKRVKKNL